VEHARDGSAPCIQRTNARQSRRSRGGDIRIESTRRADGSVVLRCTRDDGSSTWEKHEARQALFFAFHDLTHFAVETILGIRRGFYGLIADGWDIADTSGKGKRGALPAEAVLVEHLVGLFSRAPVDTSEFNAQLAMMMENAPAFTDAQLAAVRKRIDELHTAFAATGAVELTF